MPMLRTKDPDLEYNSSLISLAQDLSEERRELAAIRIAAYQQQICTAHLKKTKLHQFNIGDLVLQHVTPGTKDSAAGKFPAAWKGPYTVFGVGGKGSYTLANEDGEVIAK